MQIGDLLLYKSASPKKLGNHPIVVTVTHPEVEGYFKYTRLQGWSIGNTANTLGVIGCLAFSPLMKWSDEE